MLIWLAIVRLHSNKVALAEHPVHRPRMPVPCADRTRRCLFFPPSIIIIPPLSFSGDDARLRHTCFSPLGSGLSVIPLGFPPTFAAVFRQSCQCRRLILLFIFCSSSSLLSVRAAGDGSPRWSPLHGLALDGYSHSRCISEVLTGKTCR